MKTKIMIGFGLLSFCAVAVADPMSLAFMAADTLLATGAGGAITGLTGIGTAAAGLAGGLLGSKLAGKPAAQAVAPKPVMPLADDKAVQDARRRQIAEIQSRSGRASTVLSDPGSKLGG